MARKAWFEVDPDGLRRLAKAAPLWRTWMELVQNAWDADDVSQVDITLSHKGGTRWAIAVADDSPNGFQDIRDAYTVFGKSKSAADVSKRGRFCLGEKMVVARAIRSRVVTTTGTVAFNEDGQRCRTSRTRARGSVFEGEFTATRAEVSEFVRMLDMTAAPCDTVLRQPDRPEVVVGSAEPVATCEATLPTLTDELAPTRRRTRVSAYRRRDPNVDGWLLELGIPVQQVEGMPFNVDVGQKVPLSMSRDAVPPSYLAALAAVVADMTADLLDDDAAQSTWATLAMESCEPATAAAIAAHRFGDDAVVYDPSDPEANKRAVAEGRRVIHGSELPKAAWATLRDSGAYKPAGQVYPTAKPYSAGGTPVQVVPESEWTFAQRKVVATFRAMARLVDELPDDMPVRLVRAPHNDFAACYGPGLPMDFNVAKLGARWWDRALEDMREAVALFIHEAGHAVEGDHLSSRYYDALCSIGAQLAATGIPSVGVR